MSRFEPLGNLTADIERLVQRDAALLQSLGQRLPLDQRQNEAA